MRSMRGQGATEYLTIFAVVLLIALTAMVLMAFFPGLAGDAKTNQSSIYWRGVASPIAIPEAKLTHPGTETYSRFYWVVQNKGTEALTLTGGTVAIAGNASSASLADETKSASMSLFLSPGQEKKLTTTATTFHILGFACTPGVTYDLSLTFNYTMGGSALAQVGARPLALKCYAE